MTTPESLNGESLVSEIMQHWPETMPVFLRHKMGCIGCTMSPYETLNGAMQIYGLGLASFIGELQAAIRLARETGAECPPAEITL